MLTTIEIIQRIVDENKCISSLILMNYAPQKDLASEYQSTWTENDSVAYNAALELRAKNGLPFWNSLMLTIMNTSNCAENCLKGALLHIPNSEIERIAPSELRNIDSSKYKGGRIGLCSKVVMNGGEIRHIPMLDFTIGYSASNTPIVKDICRALGERGFILCSGKSYHFIGLKLITTDELITFLGRALLYNPIIDGVWIAHRIQDKFCCLRLGEKHGIHPYLVAEI